MERRNPDPLLSLDAPRRVTVRIVSWRGWVWAAVASVICGAFVASVLGTTPSWGRYAVAVLVIGTAATMAVHAIWLRVRETATVRGPSPDDPTGEETDALLENVSAIVTPGEISWLSDLDFVSPWRDSRMAPYRRLLELEPTSDDLVDWQVGDAVRDLLEATAAFLDFYGRNTFGDRLLLDGDWRDVGLSATEPDDAPQVEQAVLEYRQTQLRIKAARVVAAYDALSGSSPSAAITHGRAS